LTNGVPEAMRSKNCVQSHRYAIIYGAEYKKAIKLFIESADYLRAAEEGATFMIPTSIIRIWFLGLFSWVLLGAGILLGPQVVPARLEL
jgi:uncharacterized oligopeptide transporter (OPT) family protein